MKKAIIITAVIFLAACISTLGFGVALGTDAIANYIQNGTNPIVEYFGDKSKLSVHAAEALLSGIMLVISGIVLL